jgi:hypothetical protein
MGKAGASSDKTALPAAPQVAARNHAAYNRLTHDRRRERRRPRDAALGRLPRRERPNPGCSPSGAHASVLSCARERSVRLRFCPRSPRVDRLCNRVNGAGAGPVRRSVGSRRSPIAGPARRHAESRRYLCKLRHLPARCRVRSEATQRLHWVVVTGVGAWVRGKSVALSERCAASLSCQVDRGMPRWGVTGRSLCVDDVAVLAPD